MSNHLDNLDNINSNDKQYTFQNSKFTVEGIIYYRYLKYDKDLLITFKWNNKNKIYYDTVSIYVIPILS